jgi:hypothetical protein
MTIPPFIRAILFMTVTLLTRPFTTPTPRFTTLTLLCTIHILLSTITNPPYTMTIPPYTYRTMAVPIRFRIHHSIAMVDNLAC